MISIFIMYSPDRKEALEFTISCLKKMKFYDACQKTLVVDGQSNEFPSDFEIIKVPRLRGEFNWADMWNAGVCSARHDIVWYLDSDRLLPSNYISLILDNVKENNFVFTSNHFLMLQEMNFAQCQKFMEGEEGIFLEEEFMGKVKYEVRYKNPVHGPGKNVMSGNTAFLRRTYEKAGGVDRWYRGHGAFADTDFHFKASLNDCDFVDLGVYELHYKHNKLNNKEESLNRVQLYQLSLDNFIYYCNKWDLPVVLAENFALRSGISKPEKYVREKLVDYTGIITGTVSK